MKTTNKCLALISMLLVLVLSGSSTPQVQIAEEKLELPLFGENYTVGIELGGQVAILDPDGQVVSDWYTISPEDNSIETQKGQVRILYHLLGGKKPDVPNGWSYFEEDLLLIGGKYLVFMKPDENR